MSDNPIMEPADKFYGTPEVEEPIEPTETEGVSEVDQETENPDEPEKSEESEAEDLEEETQYLDLDGDEISLDEVREWRKGHLMQSDYTKKTTALAKERQTFEAESQTLRENLTKSQAEISDMKDMLTVLVNEDSEIDWSELKDDDPERYIELKEKADKRREALEKIKAEQNTPFDDPATIQAEQVKLFEANPEWLDKNRAVTDVYTKDIALLNDYAQKAGFTNDEFKNMTRSHYITTMLKAAKYDQLQEKGRKIKETREKVPVVTKPKAKVTNQPRPMSEIFYGQAKN